MNPEYEAISDLVRQMRADGSSEEVAEVFRIGVSDINDIADKRDFNDRYLRVPASLGIDARDIQLPRTIQLINRRIADLVLNKRGQKSQKLTMFHDLIPSDRLISVFEMEVKLIALGIASQKRLL